MNLCFRIFPASEAIQLIAADVTVLPLHEVEDVFTDILATVTDTLVERAQE